jgi:hypothetical protein
MEGINAEGDIIPWPRLNMLIAKRSAGRNPANVQALQRMVPLTDLQVSSLEPLVLFCPFARLRCTKFLSRLHHGI